MSFLAFYPIITAPNTCCFSQFVGPPIIKVTSWQAAFVLSCMCVSCAQFDFCGVKEYTYRPTFGLWVIGWGLRCLLWTISCKLELANMAPLQKNAFYHSHPIGIIIVFNVPLVHHLKMSVFMILLWSQRVVWRRTLVTQNTNSQRDWGGRFWGFLMKWKKQLHWRGKCSNCV